MSSIFHSSKPGKEASGFTLLEVLVSIMILAFISLGLYEATTETYRLRESLSVEGDFYNSIRLAMNIMQRDVTMLYSPMNVSPNSVSPQPSPSPGTQNPRLPRPNSPAALLATAIQQDSTLGQTFNFWEPAIDTLGTRPSRFVGTENKITLVSSSHLRIYKEAQESEFAKISYELRTDDDKPELQMLVKTEDPDVFLLEEKNDNPDEHSYKLLHGIKSFKFRYYRLDQDSWGSAWDTDVTDEQGLYPDIVEVTLLVEGPDHLSFNGRFLFRPELPLRAINPSM